MPELPDVEAFRKVLASCAQGRRIQRVEVRDAGVLHGVSAARLRRELAGRSFTAAERHGKWLLARTDDGPTLMMHFGMTGELVCADAADPPDPHDRVVFTVGRERQLRYRDQRKLKGLWLADESGVARTLDRQGPDAMTVDRTGFDAALSARRGGVKSALLDQSVLAGLGNLLADEILWRARLHPARRVRDLTDGERGRLYRAMRGTLRPAVAAGHVPPRRSWLTGRRDDTDAVCPRCAEPLRRGRIAGRGTVWCPGCQPDAS
ncbi:Fpg/Nei family DNA glycosylase [Streptomyces piniterrae]|uniref:Fpg/Nei family DNA glycosylase n=1 Tax=Streptomyces piniterrae TaxID=2571125 RepID=A0A4U0NWA1_9ACTN|nr:DNA-formamidopyrimidine glycosylase family protein [Streptomyces piniterrae]TJZ58999.1 Fpg/Nei family DNA glycosylase [Streptomyces piniterrae]